MWFEGEKKKNLPQGSQWIARAQGWGALTFLYHVFMQNLKSGNKEKNSRGGPNIGNGWNTT